MPSFHPPTPAIKRPEPPKPEPAPYRPGDIAEYCLADWRQFPGEDEPRPPGSVMGTVQCDAAIDHLFLVEAIRKGIFVRKAP
jgi:hypothetical protein